MSTYFIKQKLIMANEYNIYDFNNNPYVEVKSNGILDYFDRFLGNILSVGRTIYAKRMDGSEFVTIEKKWGFLESKHFVYVNGEEIAEISMRHMLLYFKPEIDIITKEKNYFVTGDIMGLDFEIKGNGACAAQIKKPMLKLTDSYNIDIFEGEKDELFLAVAIVIDNLIHN